MAVSLFYLNLQKDHIVADIGCGTGKVSLAISPHVSHVYAIDRRNEATELIESAVRSEGADNVEVIGGEAVDILEELEDLDGAFVGGSRDLADVLGLLSRKVRGRIVVNAVQIETAMLAIDTMKRLSIFEQAVLIQVSRSHPIGGGTMFKPINPVYIIVGGRG